MIESIRRDVSIAAPPMRVWRALTDSTEIATWMYPNTAWGEQALKGAEYGWTMMLRQLNELVTTKP